MRVETYLLLKNWITSLGYSDDITWAESIVECQSADEFAREHAFVVCNSGMRAKTATQIFRRVMQALEEGRPLSEVFGHERKCFAIQFVHDHKEELFARYQEIEGKEYKLAFLETLPHIGGIVKYHLGKNFGLQICKPDRHLVRIAAFYDTTPDELCAALSLATGDKIPTVDTVIWRAASLEIIRFRKDIPLIPSWPSERDVVEINCPYCSKPFSLNIKGLREKGRDWHLCACGTCSKEFFAEPGVGNVRVAKLPETEAEDSSPRQLSFLEEPAELAAN